MISDDARMVELSDACVPYRRCCHQESIVLSYVEEQIFHQYLRTMSIIISYWSRYTLIFLTEKYYILISYVKMSPSRFALHSKLSTSSEVQNKAQVVFINAVDKIDFPTSDWDQTGLNTFFNDMFFINCNLSSYSINFCLPSSSI